MHVGIANRRCRGSVPGIPGACATRNFMYLARGPWNNCDSRLWSRTNQDPPLLTDWDTKYIDITIYVYGVDLCKCMYICTSSTHKCDVVYNPYVQITILTRSYVIWQFIKLVCFRGPFRRFYKMDIWIHRNASMSICFWLQHKYWHIVRIVMLKYEITSYHYMSLFICTCLFMAYPVWI